VLPVGAIAALLPTMHHTPLAVTLALFQRSDEEQEVTAGEATNTKTAVLVDPIHREELCQTGRITIAMNVHGEICLLDFSGGCELSLSDMRHCHEQAARHVQPLCPTCTSCPARAIVHV
jgi:exosome complex RNA-binding protein Rrp42 (RNase PH superfamily)